LLEVGVELGVVVAFDPDEDLDFEVGVGAATELVAVASLESLGVGVAPSLSVASTGLDDPWEGDLEESIWLAPSVSPPTKIKTAKPTATLRALD
jgi:hypothetical protein